MLKIQQMEKGMEKYFEVLRKCPLFKQIEDDNLTAILGCLGAKQYSYRKNQTILRDGDAANLIGIVLKGKVQIVRIDYYGNRSIVAMIEPTQMFGESFACADEKKIPVDVVATEDSEILMVDCRRVIHSCSNACDFHRQIIFNLLKIVAKKNIMFNQKIEITSKRTTREKLITYLLQQAKKAGSDEFTIPYGRQELADYLEVDRSGLSVEIGKLKKEGIIENRKNAFKLLSEQIV